MSGNIREKRRLTMKNLLKTAINLLIISYTVFFINEKLQDFYNLTLAFFCIVGMLYILKKKRVYFSPFFIMSTVYGILLLISFLYTPAKTSGIYGLLYYATFLVVLFIITNYVNSSEKITDLVKTFVWAGVVVSINTLYYYGFDLFSLASSSTGIANTSFRIGGDIGNSNSIGMFTMFSAIFCIYLVFEKKVKNPKLYLFFSALCIMIGLLSGSKKAIIVLVIGCLILVIFKSGNLVAKLQNIFFGGIILSLIYWVIIKVPIFETISLRLKEFTLLFSGEATSSGDYARIHMIDRGLQVFSDKPFIGEGIYSSDFYFGSYSHNNYVEILMNTGILGFLIFYGIYLYYIMEILNGGIRDSKFQILAFLCLFLIIILGFGLVYYFSIYFQTLMILVSIIFDQQRKTKRKIEN